MSKIQQKIRNAFAEETPNVKQKIIDACEYQEMVAPQVVERPKFYPMKALAFALSLIVTFSLGVLASLGFGGSSKTQSVMFIDVNPSIELTLNECDEVVSFSAVNEDAVAILVDLKLKGVDVNTAVYAIVGALHLNGYLTENSNSVLISVESGKTEKGNAILEKAKAQIGKAFESAGFDCSIITQTISPSENDKHRAENYGVSLGKMAYIDQMKHHFDDLTEEELSKLNINELNFINSVSGSNNGNSTGKPNGFTDKENVLTSVLTELGVEESQVENYTIRAIPSNRENSRVVYVVTVKLYGDDTIYRYEADSVSGTIFTGDNHGGESVNNPHH